MNKYSTYNYLFQNDRVAVLYNAATDGIVALQPDLVELVRTHKDHIDTLATRHPELFRTMEEKGMIVPADRDEAQFVIDAWRRIDTDPSQFYLTIMPTLNCNLRCWYCYEEHKAHSNMTEDVRRRTLRFIDKLTRREGLRYLSLSFFGGEPLLPFYPTVWPILQQTAAWCRERDVELTVQFTTNGVLLTDDVRQKLLSLGLKHNPNFQITLDGNREKHDATRHTADGKPTYDLIISHIKAALRDGMDVNNRFNYTAGNVDTLVDVLEEYKDLTPEERKLLHFDFQQVWQDSGNAAAREKALRLADLFHRECHQIRIEKRYNRERCRDDAENQATINYDGLVYKCTARDPTPDLAEGVLTEEGDIEWNERYHRRMAVKYGNKACRACRIFPICHGGCSQTKLEAGDREDCLFGLNDDRRLEIIRGRLDFILKTKRTSY